MLTGYLIVIYTNLILCCFFFNPQERNSFEIQSLNCNFNANFIKNGACIFRTNEKNVKLLSGHGELLKPLDDVVVSVLLS